MNKSIFNAIAVARSSSALFSKTKHHWHKLLSGLLLTLTLTAPAMATTVAGAIKGSFEVSPIGAANYTVPVTVPPGVAGMQPKLKLTYDNHGANGYLGVGWNLGGLSAIERCTATIVQDGAASGVSYNGNDRYCLDGQRLVAINGAYGANGTEYRTQSETFTRVISYGTQGSGPQYFKAWTKYGQIIEYGNTTDSNITAQGRSDVRVWAADKVSDTKGNYLTISYTNDTTNGQFYPIQINYAGNANAGTTPQESVKLLYATRPDTITQYIGGSLVKNTMRMTEIQTYNGASMVQDYKLAYDNTSPDGFSLLSSLTQCAGDGTTCLPATTFAWQKSSGSFSSSAPQTAVSSVTYLTSRNGQMGATALAFGDVNGDGLADIYYRGNVYLSNGSGFAAPVNWGVTAPDAYCTPDTITTDSYGDVLHGCIYTQPDTFLADMNGDGKADLVYVNWGTGQIFVALSTGSGFSAPQAWASGASTGSPLYKTGATPIAVGDVNGDGKADLYMNGNVYLSTGSGFAAPVYWGVTAPGDKCSPATNTYGDMVSSNCTPGVTLLADVNGDGKADLVYVNWNNNDVYVALSTGSSFSAPQIWATGANPGSTNSRSQTGPTAVALGDMNGDGLADLYMNGYVYLSTGTTFTGPANWGVHAPNGYADCSVDTYGAVSNCSYLPAISLLADSTGDSKDDLMYVTWPNGPIAVSQTSSPTPDLMTGITDGFGKVTSITYQPITNGAVYTPDTNAVWPVRDLKQQELYVVSSYSNSDGVGGNYTTNFTYAGGKAHMQGGGFLGFRQVNAADAQTGITTTTDYRQDYPYNGLVTEIDKTLSNGTLVHKAANTWTNTVYSGLYHFSAVTQSVVTSNELNGSNVTTITTNTTYDNFGNPTQVSTSTGDGYTKTTNNTYTNDTTNWFLGRLTNSQVTSTTP